MLRLARQASCWLQAYDDEGGGGSGVVAAAAAAAAATKVVKRWEWDLR